MTKFFIYFLIFTFSLVAKANHEFCPSDSGSTNYQNDQATYLYGSKKFIKDINPQPVVKIVMSKRCYENNDLPEVTLSYFACSANVDRHNTVEPVTDVDCFRRDKFSHTNGPFFNRKTREIKYGKLGQITINANDIDAFEQNLDDTIQNRIAMKNMRDWFLGIGGVILGTVAFVPLVLGGGSFAILFVISMSLAPASLMIGQLAVFGSFIAVGGFSYYHGAKAFERIGHRNSTFEKTTELAQELEEEFLFTNQVENFIEIPDTNQKQQLAAEVKEDIFSLVEIFKNYGTLITK